MKTTILSDIGRHERPSTIYPLRNVTQQREDYALLPFKAKDWKLVQNNLHLLGIVM